MDGGARPVADNDRMSNTAKAVFWRRTKALSAVLLGLWLLINLLVPWFARVLAAKQFLGFPVAYWLAAEGSLLAYLMIILVYVWAMERLEAPGLDEAGAETDSQPPGPGPA